MAERSPWAFVIVIVVVIFFGVFWYIESHKAQTPAAVPHISSTAPLDTLQASVSTIEIPDFAKDF